MKMRWGGDDMMIMIMIEMEVMLMWRWWWCWCVLRVGVGGFRVGFGKTFISHSKGSRSSKIRGSDGNDKRKVCSFIHKFRIKLAFLMLQNWQLPLFGNRTKYYIYKQKKKKTSKVKSTEIPKGRLQVRDELVKKMLVV